MLLKVWWSTTVVQAMSGLMAGRRQHIYCERFSLMLESGVDLEESVAEGARCHCSQVMVAQNAGHQVQGST